MRNANKSPKIPYYTVATKWKSDLESLHCFYKATAPASIG